MGRRPVALRRPSAALLATALIALALDQASKAYIRATMKPDTWFDVIPGVLRIYHARNQGAAFGLFWGRQTFFVAMTFVILAGIAFVWWRYRPRSRLVVMSLGLVVGGAVGNLVDRLFAGRVTDFIDVHVWPVFNVADSAVVVGVSVLVMWLLFHEDEATSPSEGSQEGGSAVGGQVPGRPGNGDS
jgi:signal peptidase II